MTDKPVVFALDQQHPNDPEYLFHCPGCGYSHWFKTTGDAPCWTFNGDMVKPTISPSILVPGMKRCHMFVREGRIEFLNDCEHDLVGKTVDMLSDDW